MAEDWELIDALMGGTKAMRKAGKRFLPQWPAEDDVSYKARLATATLFPAYARTVSVLTGKPFSKPVTIGEDVPPRIVEWLGNVDLQGRNLHTFAAEVCADALAYGLCGILVDCPPSNGARTVQDERQAGIRPYAVHIRGHHILGWRDEMRGGARVLTQLRLLEYVHEDDGPFASKAVEQVRVLEPGRWAVYRKQRLENGAETWAIHDQGVTTLPVIPFVPVYGLRCGFMIGRPPMLELAHANVEHWQSKSDQQTILHVARVPLLFAKGLGDAQITVGANSFVQTGAEHADLKYVEHSGAAIEAGRLSLLDLEDRMRQVGAELLVIKPGNTTEVQTIADNEQGMCDLQRIMQAVEDSLDTALGLMAQWVGEKEGGHVSIYRDFGAATLAEASASLLFQMRSVGALSFETLLSELKRRGILSPDIDIEQEMARAKADAPKTVATEETVRP
ncbi:DUF4055 domain-containing protein [Rhodovastum atsumiense]|uniref:DUF4055 domain-containing protein n=2 Tax=Rhodovastum atsumiense TaxID=504468 RepID=A0A5M6IP72_9PROT|nr:DUF4055 domain-containing protein [Rhodovastum atsumiense]